MKQNEATVLYSLQIGRALAAIGVLIYHSALATRSAYPFIPDAYFKFFSLGHFGVDYFFVLSGFIIALAVRNVSISRAGAAQYFRSRFIRVYVPYLPVSLVMVAVLTFLPSLSMGVHDHSILASLFLLPTYGSPALSVAWTLQFEVVFYALFGLCLFVFKQPRLIFLWVIPMIAMLFITPARWEYRIVDILNAEFLFGVGAYYLYQRGRLFAARKWLVACGLALVLFSFIIMFGEEHVAFLRLITGLGYSSIVLGCAYLEREHDFSHFKRLAYFGTISYSIYLIHGPVISVILRMMNGVTPHWSIAFLTFSFAACAAGMLYFKLVEKPLMILAKRRFGFQHVTEVIAS